MSKYRQINVTSRYNNNLSLTHNNKGYIDANKSIYITFFHEYLFNFN